MQMIRQIVEDKQSSKININSLLIDYYLWDSATATSKLTDKSLDYPIHRTRSVYY